MMKVGNIVKVKVGEKFSSRLHARHQFDDEIMVIAGINEEKGLVRLVNEKVDANVNLSEISVSSARIGSEKRTALKALYQLLKKKEKLNAEMEALRDEIWKIGSEERKLREQMLELSDTVSAEWCKKILQSDIVFTRLKDDSIEIAIGIDKTIQKYASPNSFSFLSYEYDSSVFIYDREQAKREVGIDLSPYSDLVKQIKSLASKKNCKLIDITDDVEIGDKNTLYATKAFVFEIPKKAKTKDVGPILLKIDDKVQRIEACISR